MVRTYSQDKCKCRSHVFESDPMVLNDSMTPIVERLTETKRVQSLPGHLEIV
mgnify:CR=1 FL=1